MRVSEEKNLQNPDSPRIEKRAFHKVRFVVNPRSGLLQWKKPILKIINDFVAERGMDWDIILTTGPGHGKELAQEAREDGYDLVVAVGGDGTVNECGSALIGSETCLGIIPMGSGNGLARGLHIPMGIRKPLGLLDSGVVRKIDAGKIDRAYFFVTAGIGFDAELGDEFNRSKVRGPVPYFFLGVKRFFVYEPQRVILHLPDGDVERKVLLVTVANMKQYGAGAIIAPKARPDDGMFDICVIRELGIVPAVVYLPRLFTGSIDKAPFVELYRASSLVIEREREGVFHCDGEAFHGGRRLEVDILPNSLNVLVSPESLWLERSAGYVDAEVSVPQ